MKTFIKIFVISLMISLVISSFFAYGKFLDILFINIIYTGIFSSANYFYFKWIGKTMDWKNQTKKTFFTSLSGMIPLNILALFVAKYLVQIVYLGHTIDRFWQSQNISSYVYTLLIAFVIALFIINLHFIKYLNNNKKAN